MHPQIITIITKTFPSFKIMYKESTSIAFNSWASLFQCFTKPPRVSIALIFCILTETGG